MTGPHDDCNGERVTVCHGCGAFLVRGEAGRCCGEMHTHCLKHPCDLCRHVLDCRRGVHIAYVHDDRCKYCRASTREAS